LPTNDNLADYSIPVNADTRSEADDGIDGRATAVPAVAFAALYGGTATISRRMNKARAGLPISAATQRCFLNAWRCKSH